jgi:hypothetical protein
MERFRRFRVAFWLALGLCIGMAGTSFAAPTSKEIRICVSKTGGAMRMINTAGTLRKIKTNRCTAKEYLVVVNQQGMQGEPGTVGTAGVSGARGTDGSIGAVGPAGANGTNGTNGASGSSATLTCAQGGSCVLGDTGPGGGIVFYKANTQEGWGQYLEVAPATWFGGTSDPNSLWCDSTNDTVAKLIPGGTQGLTEGATATEVGLGWSNSERIARYCTTGAAVMTRMYHGGGKSDWYLPTSDELAEMCAYFGEAPTTESRTAPFAGNRSCAGIAGDVEHNPNTVRGQQSGLTISDSYWTSTEFATTTAHDCGYTNPDDISTWFINCAFIFLMERNSDPLAEYLLAGPKSRNENRVRPIRAFS